jgi:RecB family endonuclease NucS
MKDERGERSANRKIQRYKQASKKIKARILKTNKNKATVAKKKLKKKEEVEIERNKVTQNQNYTAILPSSKDTYIATRAK